MLIMKIHIARESIKVEIQVLTKETENVTTSF